ncbi:hypothetical protein [Methylobacterium sp. Leaf456]|uniref:hypothetical protein n=1 Tax=Methylobacterium sp. Leaf456 TaxID=1736382 RepID=UPI0012E35B30|nr:hypothetical protein [Methylobacterium sp. Leaf456]
MSGHRMDRARLPVGDYVWEHVTEPERESLRRFTALTAEEHAYGEVYCALGNAGIGAPMGEDEPVEDWHVRSLLESMAVARLLDGATDEGDWHHILALAAPDDAGRARLTRLFEVASGISDEEAFDEDERSERMAQRERNLRALRDLGRLAPFEEPALPARPALERWAVEGGPIPAVDDASDQLDLGIEGR